MADIAISALTEVTSADAGDDLVIETAAGTRRISRENVQLRRSELALLTPPEINVANDTVWLSDATDGLLKGVTLFNLIFGNFESLELTDTFALDPAVHNVRPLELLGTFNTPNITLSDVTAGIGGATFNLFNFSTTDITVTALDSMTIFQNAEAASPVTIRENTAATIQVKNAGNEAIFAGG